MARQSFLIVSPNLVQGHHAGGVEPAEAFALALPLDFAFALAAPLPFSRLSHSGGRFLDNLEALQLHEVALNMGDVGRLLHEFKKRKGEARCMG